MRDFVLLTSICFYSLCLQSQTYLSFGVDGYETVLSNIVKERMVPQWHSGGEFTMPIQRNVSPVAMLEFSPVDHLVFQWGISYQENYFEFNFDYYNENFRAQYRGTLWIRLRYLQMPMRVMLREQLTERSDLLFALQLRPDMLMSFEDNSFYVVQRRPNWNDFFDSRLNRYNSMVLSGGLAGMYQYKFSSWGKLQLSVFVNRDFTSLMSRDLLWDFYHNLYPARRFQYGAGLAFLVRIKSDA